MSTEEIKEYIGTQLKALTSIASPTGFTKNATDYLMKQLEAMGYAPQLSNKGNVSVEIGGEGAWLNSNPNKIVIGPKYWFNPECSLAKINHIIPNKWIKL